MNVQEALTFMRLTEAEKESIFSIVSGILLLGNVEISSIEKQGIPDAASLAEEPRQLLHEACGLLYLDSALIEEGLSVKISNAGGQEIRGPWKQDEGRTLKDSLAKVTQVSPLLHVSASASAPLVQKYMYNLLRSTMFIIQAMYDKLFDWIVKKLNQTIEPSRGFHHFMGELLGY